MKSCSDVNVSVCPRCGIIPVQTRKGRHMELLLWIGIILVLVLAAVFFGAAPFLLFDYAATRKLPVTPSSEEDMKGTKWEKYGAMLCEGMQYIRMQTMESVNVTSFDGLKLHGRYFPSSGERKGAILLAHGFHSCADFDFSCIVRYYHEQGYAVLLIDQRTHGESEGTYIGFGILERRDIAVWADWLSNKVGENTDVFLEGISMGATSVLMASCERLPANVRGIISDCPFSSPMEEFRHVLRTQFHLPPAIFLPLTNRICKRKAGYGFSDFSTIEAMRHNHLPILFIHGLADHFVPPEMTIRTYEACTSEKKLVLVENAAHGLSYLTDKSRCEAELMSFLSMHARHAVNASSAQENR